MRSGGSVAFRLVYTGRDGREPLLYSLGHCEVDVLTGELRCDGRVVPLQAKPFMLLVHLIRNRHRLVEHDELLEALWHGTVVGDAALRRAVKVVRRAIGDDGVTQRCIQTVRGRGYRFVGEVDTHEPLRPAIGPGVVPSSSDRFVGREALLAVVAAARADLGEGRGQLLLLHGEAGIGKTRALDETARHAGDADFVLGACFEGDATSSYLPWRQALVKLLETRGEESFQRAAGRGVADLAAIDPRLVPQDGSAARAPGRRHSDFRLRETVTRLISGLATERSLVVAFDDLHWSDLGSLRLLLHLARSLRSMPALVIGTLRDFEGGLDPRRRELLAQIERTVPGATTALPALEAIDVEQLLRSRGHAEVPGELIHELLEQSGGNPFFVVQLLNTLGPPRRALDTSSLRGRSSAIGLEAILRQVAPLSEACRRVLQTAAVIGTRVTRGVLFLACDSDRADLVAALAEAQRAGLLRELPNQVHSYQFAHALVADALRRTAPADWLAETHARVGTALEQLSESQLEPRDAEIAHHFLAAGSGSETRAIAYFRRAGRSAESRAASHEAVTHFEHAVQLLGQLPEGRAELAETLLELGEARTRAHDNVGGRESLMAAANLARDRDDLATFARAAIGYSRETAIGGYQPESIGLLEEALSWVRMRPKRARAGEQAAQRTALESRVVSRLAYARFYLDPPAVRAERAAEGVALAARCGDRRVQAQALVDYHYCLIGAASLPKRQQVTQELEELARSVRDDELAGWIHKFRVENALEAGDPDAIARACELHEAVADELREPLFRCHSLHHRAMQALRTGEFDTAERRAHEGLDLGLLSGHQIAIQFYGVQHWTLRREQGRLEELDAQVQNMIDNFPEDTGWRAALAYAYAERGDANAAAAQLAQIVDHERHVFRSSVNWSTTPALLAEVARRLGDVARARVLYDELLPHRSSHVVVSLSMADFGPVERYLGLCAETFDADLARRHLDAALERVRAGGAESTLARLAVDVARVSDSAARTRQLANEALKRAERLGMPDVARAAAALAAA